MSGLPVAQFPAIAPPEVQVSAIYVGADAQTIEQSVATPIEQQMSGVDNMNYMYSLNATANGQMRMIVDFDVATDPNTDLILAQSRETQAASQLPADVINYGVTVQKSVLAPLMLVALYSPKGTYNDRFLANYAYINLNDPLTRVKGVGQVQIFGAGQYAMRLWVKPDQLAKLAITVPEIISAIQTQNTVNPAGQVGGEPIPKGQPFTYSVRALGRLTTPEEFGDIVVRETPQTGIVRVRDVARVELGSQDYSVTGHLDGKPSAVIAVYQLPGSNAVETAAGVTKMMADAKKRFPGDIDFVVPVDTTRAVNAGIQRNCRNTSDRHRAGGRCGLHISAGLAFDADTAAGRSGVAGRGIRFLSAVRVQHQYTVAVRIGAGRRPRRRRCDRGRGSRRAPHRRRPRAEAGGAQSHGRDFGPRGRNRPGALGGIHSDGFYPGHHRPSLSAVRGHHRDLGDSFRVQCALAQPRARQPDSASEASGQRTAGGFLPVVQSRIRQGHGRLCAGVGLTPAQSVGLGGASGRLRRGRPVDRRQTALQFCAR